MDPVGGQGLYFLFLESPFVEPDPPLWMDRDCAVFGERAKVEVRFEDLGVQCESIVGSGVVMVFFKIEGDMRRAGGEGSADRDVSAPGEKGYVVGSDV